MNTTTPVAILERFPRPVPSPGIGMRMFPLKGEVVNGRMIGFDTIHRLPQSGTWADGRTWVTSECGRQRPAERWIESDKDVDCTMCLQSIA